MSINLAITVNSVFERPRDRERMDLVTGQKKNQSQVRTMKMYSKVPESRDKEEQKSENQKDGAKSDKSNVIENKDENKITTVKHLRFGIENILQQESKAVKTERQIRESVSLGLSAVSGFYGQPFSLQKGGKLGTCYPYCSEVVLPWRETGSEKTTNCQSKIYLYLSKLFKTQTLICSHWYTCVCWHYITCITFNSNFLKKLFKKFISF